MDLDDLECKHLKCLLTILTIGIILELYFIFFLKYPSF